SVETTILDNEDAVQVDSIARLRDGREDGNADEDHWPGWTLNVNNAADTPTTLTLRFDPEQQATLGEDFTGKLHIYTGADNDPQSVTVTDISQPVIWDLPAGTQNVQVFVEPMDDALYESSENLILNAKVDSANADWVVSETVYLTDDESAPVVDTLTPDSTTVAEEDNTNLSWTLSLNNASATATTLLLDISNPGQTGNFTADTNGTFTLYSADGTQELDTVNVSTAVNGIVKVDIPPGHKTVNIKTTLNNDNVYEGTETFSLKAAVDGTDPGIAADAISVTDEADIPMVSTVSDTTIDEGEHAEVTITLTHPSTTVTNVTIDAL
ncbi:hypothetical protein, partial [Veronia pacifica]